MSQTANQHGERLRLKTPRYINIATLHLLVVRIAENIIGRIREVEKIKRTKRVEKAIKKVRYTQLYQETVVLR